MNKSAAVPGLNREDAYRLQVLLPPLPEQRRIADVLDRADTLRAMRRQVIVDLDALTYAIFHDLFETHADSSWQTVRMDDVAEIITGFPFRSDRYVANDGVRLCRGANVLPGRIDWTDLASWPKAEEEEFADFRLRPGDVLIAMDRPWIAEGFKIAQIQSQDCPSLLVQRVARIRAKSGLSNDFLLYLLNQPFFARHCKPTETTVPHISPKEIRSFCFSLPPHSLQAQFSRFMTAFKQLKALQMKSLGEIDALFASLQDGAFGSVSGR